MKKIYVLQKIYNLINKIVTSKLSTNSFKLLVAFGILFLSVNSFSQTKSTEAQSLGLYSENNIISSGGSYTLKLYAADPEANRAPYTPTYDKLTVNALTCPDIANQTGRADNPLPDAVAYASPGSSSDLDAVTSLAPKDMSLCQIVPFFMEITVNGSTSPEGGKIHFLTDLFCQRPIGITGKQFDLIDHGNFSLS